MLKNYLKFSPLILMALGASACGSLERDICERLMRCEGGNDVDADACVAMVETQKNIADAYGCTDEWDEYLICIDDYSYCLVPESGGNGDFIDYGDDVPCDRLNVIYSTCIDRNSEVR